MRCSICARGTPSASSFRSEIGDSITVAFTPRSTSACTSAATAREKPQISARRPLSMRPPPRAGRSRALSRLVGPCRGVSRGSRQPQDKDDLLLPVAAAAEVELRLDDADAPVDLFDLDTGLLAQLSLRGFRR